MDILVGFRFHPTDEEIICLLQEKRRDPDFSVHAILETNIYDFEPFELSGLSPIQSDEKWCSFFCAPNYINVVSKRATRATKTGYWKLTGKGCKIKEKRTNKVIGRKRILVFYERPSGCKEIKTNWVMHQFSTEDSSEDYKKDFVVYRVKRKRDKKRRISSSLEGQRQKKHRISTSDEGQPSHHMAFDNGNPVEETFSSLSQLLPSNYLDSDPSDHVAENISPLSNCSVSSPRYHVAENTLQVNSQLVENSIAFDACNGFDQTSFSTLQSPINLEQGSSHSVVSSSDYDVLNSPFCCNWEDDSVNPCPVVQDEYPREDTGHSTLPRDFNSSKSVTGFCGGHSCEIDSEAFGEWVNGMFEY